MGLGGGYAPGTVRDAYVLANPFEGNNLTKDREMYDYMIRQTRAHPDVALAGPTLNWLYEALKETRDLARRPLMAFELKAYQGLVFDPPRAGAEFQCREIAKSAIPRVAAVSCNPATLARDLRILIDGGYKLKSVTPIDQFLWTPHVEAVALLEK